MRLIRLFWFTLSILLGVAAGMALGWNYLPVPQSPGEPARLRADYRADYVLMTAEIFAVDGSLQHAGQRLEALGGRSPLRHAQEAILTARDLDYSPHDMELLINLVKALQALEGSG